MMVKILTEGAQFGGGERWQRGAGSKKLGSHSSSAWEKVVEGPELGERDISGRSEWEELPQWDPAPGLRTTRSKIRGGKWGRRTQPRPRSPWIQSKIW